jgi:hypothetical protein
MVVRELRPLGGCQIVGRGAPLNILGARCVDRNKPRWVDHRDRRHEVSDLGLAQADAV